MKILLSTLSMSYLSGAPLYVFEIARELRRLGHDVQIVSDWRGGLTGVEGHKLKEELELATIKCVQFGDRYEMPDFIIASERDSEKVLDEFPNVPAIVVIHSEYECETPISDRTQILKYICIRQSILRHIIDEHQIPEEKCVVVYNGIDRERFKKKKKEDRDYYKIVVPCTLDTLREAFLNSLIDSASEQRRVFLYGMDCGAKLHKSEWVKIYPDKFHIEDEIADADEIAGILLGRVNLEAWSCGVKSSIYDPVTLEHKVYDAPLDFDRNHNIKNVAKQLLSFYESLEDISFVIPHHNRHDKLSDLLKSIEDLKNIYVIKGGTFAENVNRGVSFINTKYVCILNDDIVIQNHSIFRAAKNELKDYDVVSATPSSGCKGFRISNGVLIEIRDKNEEVEYPSGFFLMMKAEMFRRYKGFDESFRNGCEDVDLYLRMKDCKFFVLPDVIIHNEASSANRFDSLSENIELFNKKWKNICQIKSIL
jgi:hypothetical protein